MTKSITVSKKEFQFFIKNFKIQNYTPQIFNLYFLPHYPKKLTFDKFLNLSLRLKSQKFWSSFKKFKNFQNSKSHKSEYLFLKKCSIFNFLSINFHFSKNLKILKFFQNFQKNQKATKAYIGTTLYLPKIF